MHAPLVLILESSATVVNLLAAAYPLRSWLLRSVRELAEVQEELRSARPAVVVAEPKPRFLEAIVWTLEHRPAVPVVLLNEQDQLPWLELGITCSLDRAEVFERLPALVDRMLNS
jgi:hypothetical protein